MALACATAACGGGEKSADEATTTAAVTSSAAASTAPAGTGAGGYDLAGYHLEPVDPATIGFNAPAGAVTSATAFRVTKGGALVGEIVQAIPPEDQPPTDESLLEVLATVAETHGGTPQAITLGDTTGFAVETDDGKVVVAHMLEDASLQFTFGTDRAAVVAMIRDLSTSQPGSQ